MKKLLLLFILIPFIGLSQVQIGQDIDGEYGGYQSGNSVSSSSSGDIVAIGSPYRGGAGSASSGHVQIYENISGVWTQVGQDIDGEVAYDRSGTSVSLSDDGSIVAIGAPGNDDNGEDSGHVRVYENISGVWTQIGQDIDGEVAEDGSGSSVSLSSDGNIVAIGAPYNDGNGEDSTHVRVYENTSGVWTQIGQDIDGEASEDAGYFTIMSLSLSDNGNILAIGAPGNDGNGSNSGHVRVYENISGVWTQIGQDIDGEAENNFSGTSVSISGDGNIVAIGAPFNNRDVTTFYSGHVRLYENVSGVWTQIGEDIDGEAFANYSGISVSLSSNGSIVTIGAPNNNNYTGHVRLYENVSGVWIQIGEDIDGEATGDVSGSSVSLSSNGSIVTIGAPNNGGNSGHVRVYENVSGTWTQTGQDIDGDPAFDQSGSSISLSGDGNIVAISAPGNDDNGADSGHVRLYENISGVWIQIGEDIDGEAAYDRSGTSVSLSDDGSIVAIGAPNNNGYSGHVRLYENVSGVWIQIGEDIDGEAAGDGSSSSVSLSSDGSIIAIGAPNNDGNGGNSGHVRVYENVSGVWTQIGQDIDGEAVTDWNGTSVSLSSDGNIVAIGAEGTDVNGAESGHVRVYENVSGVWTQIGQDIDGEAEYDRSGDIVRLSSDGSIVAIGAERNDGNGNVSGHVRVYENVSGVWTQIGTDIDGEDAGDISGSSVSLSSDGSIVAIGAYLNDGNGYRSGHVRVYKNVSGVWTQIGIDIDGESEDDWSGKSVSLSSDGSIVAIGAPYNDGNGYRSGHVRVFDLSTLLSANKQVIKSFNLYPNPTKNQVTIQLENTTELQNVTIYNNLGQQVLTSKKSVIDTSKLASGLYLVEIETNKGKGSKKLIIE